MQRTVIPLLLVWAVVATLMALRPTRPRPPVRPRTDRVEIERLKRRIVELERRAEPGSGPGVSPPFAPDVKRPKTAPKTYGEAADRLLGEYRDLRDRGVDEYRRREILEEIARLADRDRSIHLVWPHLLQEALTDDDADDIVWGPDLATRPDPGGPIDVRCRAELRAILATDAKAFRRAAAAAMLMENLIPQREDFRAALDAARRERDTEFRIRILEAMGNRDLRPIADPADATTYLESLREELKSGETSVAGTLATWSEAPEDFDLLRSLLTRSANGSLLWAFRGQRALTKGREAECRAALTAVIEKPGASSTVKVTAVTVLNSLRPWDAATAEAVRRFREGRK